MQEKVIEGILADEQQAIARSVAPTAVDPIQQTISETIKDSIRRRSADREEAKTCMKCPLSETRTNVVIGKGNPNADILFIGEAPGKNEDLQGLPFVGAAGKNLDKFLSVINLT